MSMAEAGIGIVQKSPERAIPGSQSCLCLVGSPTAPVSYRSIQMKPNAPLRRRPSMLTYVPCMNRMSVSKSNAVPSLPSAVPRT